MGVLHEMQFSLYGFDFKVEDSVTVLRFRLEIAGNSLASEVQAVRNNEHPRANPFVVNLR